VHPLAPGVSGVLAQVDGLCAAYLAACAKVFGRLPLAQIRSGWAAAALLLLAGGAWAYACRDGRPKGGLPGHRYRPAESEPGGAQAP
jgi:hypothetical protein